MSRLKSFFKNRRNLVIGLIILLAIVFFIWKQLGRNQSQPRYQTASVERGTIVSSVSASGNILSSNMVSVTTQASGTVKQIFVKDGQTVKQADNILEINLDSAGQQRNAQAWSNYLSAKNSLDSAQATAYSLQSDMFTKWKSFYDLATNSTYQNSDGSPNLNNRALAEFHVSQDDWLAAEAKYKNQQAVINQAQAALNNSWLSYRQSSPIITSPINGTLKNLVVVDGMIINPSSSTVSSNTVSSQQIAVVQNESLPLASFSLSEIDVNKVIPGQRATVTLDSLSGKTFTGKVMTVDKIGTVTSGVTSYPVIIQFDTNIPQILPNMATTANIIITSKDNALLIPSAAIQTSNGQTVARVLKNNQEQFVPVETGLTSDTQTEIISGLKEGDTVITGTLSTGTGSQNTSPFSGGFGRGGNAVFRGR